MLATNEREVVKSLAEIASSLKDIRGVIYDLAPKKTLGEDGEVEVTSSGFMEDMVRKAMLDQHKKDNRKRDALTMIDELYNFVVDKNQYIQSGNETTYILNVVAQSLNDIRDGLKGWS